MLTNVRAFDLLHRTLGHVDVQHIEDFPNTGHVDWCHEFHPARFNNLSDLCVICQLPKSKRRTFSSSQPVVPVPGLHCTWSYGALIKPHCVTYICIFYWLS